MKVIFIVYFFQKVRNGGVPFPLNMIDLIVFNAVSAIFQPYDGSDYKLKVISFEILKFPWHPSQAYFLSKSSEMVFWVPRGLLSLSWGTI